MRHFCKQRCQMSPRGVGCSAALMILSDALPQATWDSAKAKEALTRSHLESQNRPSNNELCLIVLRWVLRVCGFREDISSRYELLRYRSSTLICYVFGVAGRQRTCDEIQPPTSCIKSIAAASTAKSRGIRFDVVLMTLFSRSNRNDFSKKDDIEHLTLIMDWRSTSDSIYAS